jgi:hypothetical protein
LTSLPKHKPIHIHSFIYYTSLMLLNFHSLGRGNGSTKFTLNVLPIEGQFSPAFTFQVTSAPNWLLVPT